MKNQVQNKLSFEERQIRRINQKVKYINKSALDVPFKWMTLLTLITGNSLLLTGS